MAERKFEKQALEKSSERYEERGQGKASGKVEERGQGKASGSSLEMEMTMPAVRLELMEPCCPP